MNDDDNESADENRASFNEFYIACIYKHSLWKVVNPMKKTMEQKRIIRAILTTARAECGRTADDVVAWSERGVTRNLYYHALDGDLSDEAMLCMFMACLAGADVFDNYCKACGIYLCTEYEYGRIIREYIIENDKHYDVLDLNERLVNAGQPPLFKTKAA